MTDKTITLSFTGDSDLIDESLTAFVKAHGYDDSFEQTEIEFAKEVLSQFMRESILDYTIEQKKKEVALTTITETESKLDEVAFNID